MLKDAYVGIYTDTVQAAQPLCDFDYKLLCLLDEAYENPSSICIILRSTHTLYINVILSLTQDTENIQVWNNTDTVIYIIFPWEVHEVLVIQSNWDWWLKELLYSIFTLRFYMWC